MPKFYFYKLTVDDGGAPCVERGILSLAICKPMIRQTAEDGDVIFGFAAKALHKDNRLIYIARVTKALRKGEYYKVGRYSSRSDCIYRWEDGTYRIEKGARFHGTQDHLEHDLGKPPLFDRANVLVSKDFRYLGGSCPEDYKHRFSYLAMAIESLKQGHRVYHSERLRSELKQLLDETFETHAVKENGLPSQRPRRNISHRGETCGLATVTMRPIGEVARGKCPTK